MGVRVHLDTSVLRGYVSDKNGERSEAQRQISRLTNRSYETVISQIVLGEALATIIRDYKGDPTAAYTKIKCLYEKLMDMCRDLDHDIPPITMKILEEANRLTDIDGTDKIIAAHALLDPDSQRLVSYDRRMIDSKEFRKEEERLREAGKRKYRLEIVDGL